VLPVSTDGALQLGIVGMRRLSWCLQVRLCVIRIECLGHGLDVSNKRQHQNDERDRIQHVDERTRTPRMIGTRSSSWSGTLAMLIAGYIFGDVRFEGDFIANVAEVGIGGSISVGLADKMFRHGRKVAEQDAAEVSAGKLSRSDPRVTASALERRVCGSLFGLDWRRLCAPDWSLDRSGAGLQSRIWLIRPNMTAVLQQVQSINSRFRGRFHGLKRLVLIAQMNRSLVDAWINSRGVNVNSVKLL